MKIGIIGAGNMGRAFARRIIAAGHEVAIASKDLEHAEAAAKAAGGRARAVPLSGVGRGSDLIIAATPAGAQVDALQGAGDLTGKTVVEIANPLKSDLSGMTVGHTTSFAEEVARELPGARIVKGFNTVFAQVLEEAPALGGRRPSVFLAGDDAAAKSKVMELAESIGFEPIDSGPLSNARYLEPMGFLNIWLGYVAKWGTGIGPSWSRKA
jgi:hypothetical protein